MVGFAVGHPRTILEGPAELRSSPRRPSLEAKPPPVRLTNWDASGARMPFSFGGQKRSFYCGPCRSGTVQVPRDVGGALSAELAVWIRFIIWVVVIE